MTPRERPGARWRVPRVALAAAVAAALVASAVLPAPLHGQRVVKNTARVFFRTPVGADSATSNTTETVVDAPVLSLEISLRGSAQVAAGDDVAFRLQYRNGSTLPALQGVLVDTIPEGMTLVSVRPAATLSGRVVTWSLGDLQPGMAGDVDLVLRVSASGADTIVHNVAVLSAANAHDVVARSPPLRVAPGASESQLEVEVRADVLQVGIGETVPYSITLRNRSDGPMHDPRVHVTLAAGTRFLPGGTVGVDSVRTSSTGVTLFLSGVILPGERRTVRYGVVLVSARTASVTAIAHATASGARGSALAFSSAETRVGVEVRQAAPMETRTVIGKVWVDLDGDGVQGRNEPGLANADVWSDDGEVVTTDSAGRLSFRNVRRGRHAFRLDPASLRGAYDAADAASVLRTVEVDGWSTPGVSFRVVPTATRPVVANPDSVDAAGNPTENASAAPVSIAPLRTAAARASDARGSLSSGPGVAIFAPADGSVLRNDRIWIGVRAEPGVTVALYDGDSLQVRARTRADGVHDFIAVALAPGPHRLRVRVENSWGQARWDSMAVHVGGQPATLVADRDTLRLTADAGSATTLRVRVADRWGVPVVNGAHVTIASALAVPAGIDVDPSSVGLQLATGPDGWLTVPVHGGREIGSGTLSLRSGAAAGAVAVRMNPAVRALMVTGSGRVGTGAIAGDYGSISARGKLGNETAIVLGYDSRRLDAGRDAFGRTIDPLEESQYPVVGDASQRRTLTAASSSFSARVERGLDWLAFGDVGTGEFGSGLRLTGYQRSLSGAAARVTTGAVAWNAFGSATTGTVGQQHIRGAGVSGPYALAPGIRPGTERILLDTRAVDNPQRILSQEALVRFIDYQIDYELGVLLLKRPVPAADVYGNPVFILVAYESDGGGPRGAVIGVRASGNARAITGFPSVDSLRLGTSLVHDGAPGASRSLVGADFRLLQAGRVDLSGELAYSQSPDSAGLAASFGGSMRLSERGASLSAHWTRVGGEFANASNRTLRSGSQQLEVGALVPVGNGQVRLRHERASFGAENLSRERSAATGIVPLASDLGLEASLTADRLDAGLSGPDASQGGEMKLTWTPADSPLRLWVEGRRQLSHRGTTLRPDHLAIGTAVQVTKTLSVEARRYEVMLPGDSGHYGVTNVGLRSRLAPGTEAWGSYQLAGIDGPTSAALVGLSNRIAFGSGWTVNSSMEQRRGLDRAPVSDPLRALPFLQEEESYTAAAGGIEYLPVGRRYRLSARGEYRDGTQRSTRLFTAAADASITPSLALLTRQEYLGAVGATAAQRTGGSQLSSLWGVGFRPAGNGALNLLAKLELVRADNAPGGGALTREGFESRTILATDAVWAPSARGELALRYAMRRTSARPASGDLAGMQLGSWADYIGTRGQYTLNRRAMLRTRARLLAERLTGTHRWDVSPELVLMPGGGLEVGLGRRFGDLDDPDFGMNRARQSGWFATMSVQGTERAIGTIADFWSSRLGVQ